MVAFGVGRRCVNSPPRDPLTGDELMAEDYQGLTPPPELVTDWRLAPEYTDGLGRVTMVTITVDRLQYIATQAARWGANQELEACCEWVQSYAECGDSLRVARRPKPPSLAAQALNTLSSMQIDPVIINGININKHVMDQYNIIRTALERLQELENNG